MYVKLINETTIEKAPNCINANGSVIMNPNKEQYSSAGYYELIESKEPEKRKWYDLVSKYSLIDKGTGSYIIVKTDEEGNTTEEVIEVDMKEVEQTWDYIKQEKPDYEELTVQYIRESYSINDEIAMLRQKDSGAKKSDFDDYNIYCEECKQRANKDIEEWQKA